MFEKHRAARVAVLFTLLSSLVSVDLKNVAARPSASQTTTAREFVHLKATLDTGPVEWFALSPPGDLLALSREGGGVQLWDVAGGKLLRVLQGFEKPPALFWSRDGKRLAAHAAGKRAVVWDALSGLELASVESPERDIRELRWSPDGRALLTVTRDDGVKANWLGRERTEISIWDAATGRLKSKLTIKELDVSVRFSPDGRQILTTGSKLEAQLWDADSGELRATLRPLKKIFPTPSTTGGFLAGGRRVVVGGYMRGVTLWDAATGRLEAELVEPPRRLGDRRTLRSASPDGRLVLVYRERNAGTLGLKTESTMELRDSRSGQVTAELTGANMLGAAHQVVWSRDGRALVTAGGRRKYEGKIWDAATGRLRATFPAVAKVGFSLVGEGYEDLDLLSFHPTRPVLMAASRKLIRFWNSSDGSLLQAIEGEGARARFSRDGLTLVTLASDRKSVRVWELAEKPHGPPAPDGPDEEWEAQPFGFTGGS